MSTLLRFLIEYPVVVGTLFAVSFAAARLLFVPEDRKRCDWLLAASALALPASATCEFFTNWLGRLEPTRLDQYVFRFDGLFGQPSFAMGQFVARHFWLEVISNMAYSALPCAVLAVFAAYLWRRTEAETLALLRTFILNLFVAVPIYLLIPVGGPAAAFPGFPLLPPHFVAHVISRPGPPNGFPSVHTSTALLILWFARRRPAARILGVLYLALIVVATLGSGQHYLFDLFAAIPYAVVMIRLGKVEWRWSPSATHSPVSEIAVTEPS